MSGKYSRSGSALQGGVAHVQRHHVDRDDVTVPEDVLADFIGVVVVFLFGDGEVNAGLDEAWWDVFRFYSDIGII